MDIMRQAACLVVKIRKVAKTRNGYNQVPHLTQDTTWAVTKTQVNITNKQGQPFPSM